MDKPRIIEKYESIKEHQEQLAKEDGREDFIYDIDSEIRKRYNELRNRRIWGGPKRTTKYLKEVQEHEFAIEYLDQQKKQKSTKETEQASIRQAAMSFYFMRHANMFPKSTGNFTTDADYIHYLTGLNKDKLRKQISKPFARPIKSTPKAVQSLVTDVKAVIFQFEKIQFHAGIELAEQKIKELEADLESFE
ncbi:hypothetical protein [Carboxylicivirga marina]|uniref:hypothetical protein n=1 Tax=Carboxylicivirga marina TaxID=2800988 RepID=UPI0025980757|nr:hypothetical protein [uncultured Carboxylicivirga sp.]